MPASWEALPGRRWWVNREALAVVWVQETEDSDRWEVVARTVSGVTVQFGRTHPTAVEAADFAERICR